MRQIGGQHGFTLLEVLVAFLVLSIGLIGLAGLQVSGVKNGRDAYYRTQAVALAYDITDRMRANLEGVVDDEYHLEVGSEDADCRNGTGCSAAEMAGDDVFLWKAAVSRLLPDGSAVVCRDSTPADATSAAAPNCDNVGDAYVAHVWWNDDADSNNAQARVSVTFIP